MCVQLSRKSGTAKVAGARAFFVFQVLKSKWSTARHLGEGSPSLKLDQFVLNIFVGFLYEKESIVNGGLWMIVTKIVLTSAENSNFFIFIAEMFYPFYSTWQVSAPFWFNELGTLLTRIAVIYGSFILFFLAKVSATVICLFFTYQTAKRLVEKSEKTECCNSMPEQLRVSPRCWSCFCWSMSTVPLIFFSVAAAYNGVLNQDGSCSPSAVVSALANVFTLTKCDFVDNCQCVFAYLRSSNLLLTWVSDHLCLHSAFCFSFC